MVHPAPRPTPPSYAEQLLGRAVTGGLTGSWKVAEQLPRRAAGATGGTFSVGYIVENANGQRAYLKALDLSLAFFSSDPTRELQAMTAAFNFERDLLVQCRDRRLDRVVIAIDHGQHAVDPMLFASVVPFIIFELADGDVRKVMSFAQQFDVAWALRTLHQVVTGLVQLHRNDIAHQDLKPSNVMLFSGGADAKLGDLGRASQQGFAPPHDGATVAGDKTYAPPELLYGEPPADWTSRRFGCDAYLLGSLVVSLLSGISMTGLLTGMLAPSQHWRSWRGTYAAILPLVRDAFDRAVALFAQQVPIDFRVDVERIVRQLCDPDPGRRGHPRARAVRHGNPLALDRYVAEFDLLARRAERGMRGSKVLPTRATGTGGGNP
jgi:eukaryotic-like serine/threonine-protein kinase